MRKQKVSYVERLERSLVKIIQQPGADLNRSGGVRALLVFLSRRRADVIYDIVNREMDARDKTCRILSLDDEYRNEELCDLTVAADRAPEIVAADVAAACEM